MFGFPIWVLKKLRFFYRNLFICRLIAVYRSPRLTRSIKFWGFFIRDSSLYEFDWSLCIRMYISRSTITMSPTRVLRTGFILLAILGRLTCADELSRVSNPVCPTKSIKASILGIGDSICPSSGIGYSIGVIEVFTRLWLHVIIALEVISTRRFNLAIL